MGLFFFLFKFSFNVYGCFSLTYVSIPHIVHGGQEVTSDPWDWICHVGDGNQISIPPEEQQVLLSTEVPLQTQAVFQMGRLGLGKAKHPAVKQMLIKKKKPTYSALAVSPA